MSSACFVCEMALYWVHLLIYAFIQGFVSVIHFNKEDTGSRLHNLLRHMYFAVSRRVFSKELKSVWSTRIPLARKMRMRDQEEVSAIHNPRLSVRSWVRFPVTANLKKFATLWSSQIVVFPTALSCWIQTESCRHKQTTVKSQHNAFLSEDYILLAREFFWEYASEQKIVLKDNYN